MIEKSISSSFDLRLAESDKRIASADKKIARADLFPTLTAGYNTQYSKGLSGGAGGSQVAVVGNTILPGATGFQHVYTLSANYTLFDGGSRYKTFLAAKMRTQATAAARQVLLRDLKLTLTQLYTDALIDFESLKALERTRKLHKRLFALKKELQESGQISKIELAEEALRLATVESNIDRLQESLGEKLSDLSAYTQDRYEIADLDMAELAQTAEDSQPFSVKVLPDLDRYNKEIESRKAELAAISLQRLPQVGFYSNLVFYGGDQNNWSQALMNTAARQVYMGLNVSMPLFDGLKNSGMRMKKRAEIERLTIERDKRVFELRSQHEKFSSAARQFSVELQTDAQLLSTSKEKLGMVQTLSDRKLIDISTLINEEITGVEHGLSLKKARILRLAAQLKASIIASG